MRRMNSVTSARRLPSNAFLIAEDSSHTTPPNSRQSNFSSCS